MRGKQSGWTADKGAAGYAERRRRETAQNGPPTLGRSNRARESAASGARPLPAPVRQSVHSPHAAHGALDVAETTRAPQSTRLDGSSENRESPQESTSRTPEQLAAREKWRRAGVTERELEVWELAAMGMDRVAIGRTLHIARGTVQKHFENLNEKLEVNSGERLVALAWQEGLVERGEVKEVR